MRYFRDKRLQINLNQHNLQFVYKIKKRLNGRISTKRVHCCKCRYLALICSVRRFRYNRDYLAESRSKSPYTPSQRTQKEKAGINRLCSNLPCMSVHTSVVVTTLIAKEKAPGARQCLIKRKSKEYTTTNFNALRMLLLASKMLSVTFYLSSGVFMLATSKIASDGFLWRFVCKTLSARVCRHLPLGRSLCHLKRLLV